MVLAHIYLLFASVGTDKTQLPPLGLEPIVLPVPTLAKLREKPVSGKDRGEACAAKRWRTRLITVLDRLESAVRPFLHPRHSLHDFPLGFVHTSAAHLVEE